MIEREVVKIGERGRHLEIPRGWKLIKDGDCEEGDRFANLWTRRWEPVDVDDIGDPAEWFDYLIREIDKCE